VQPLPSREGGGSFGGHVTREDVVADSNACISLGDAVKLRRRARRIREHENKQSVVRWHIKINDQLEPVLQIGERERENE
jgi:hypothetical protein